MLQMSNLYRVQLILGKAKETDMHAECAILFGKVSRAVQYSVPFCMTSSLYTRLCLSVGNYVCL